MARELHDVCFLLILLFWLKGRDITKRYRSNNTLSSGAISGQFVREDNSFVECLFVPLKVLICLAGNW